MQNINENKVLGLLILITHSLWRCDTDNSYSSDFIKLFPNIIQTNEYPN